MDREWFSALIILAVVCLSVIFSGNFFGIFSGKNSLKQEKKNIKISELVLKTNTIYNNFPVEVVISDTGDKSRVSLRLKPKDYDDSGLNFLKNMVEEIGSSDKIGQKIKLQDGYCLIYDGGYPIWAPNHLFITSQLSIKGEGSYVFLLFAQKVWWNGKEIHLRGEDEKPVGFYPYKL